MESTKFYENSMSSNQRTQKLYQQYLNNTNMNNSDSNTYPIGDSKDVHYDGRAHGRNNTAEDEVSNDDNEIKYADHKGYNNIKNNIIDTTYNRNNATTAARIENKIGDYRDSQQYQNTIRRPNESNYTTETTYNHMKKQRENRYLAAAAAAAAAATANQAVGQSSQYNKTKHQEIVKRLYDCERENNNNNNKTLNSYNNDKPKSHKELTTIFAQNHDIKKNLIQSSLTPTENDALNRIMNDPCDPIRLKNTYQRQHFQRSGLFQQKLPHPPTPRLISRLYESERHHPQQQQQFQQQQQQQQQQQNQQQYQQPQISYQQQPTTQQNRCTPSYRTGKILESIKRQQMRKPEFYNSYNINKIHNTPSSHHPSSIKTYNTSNCDRKPSVLLNIPKTMKKSDPEVEIKYENNKFGHHKIDDGYNFEDDDDTVCQNQTSESIIKDEYSDDKVSTTKFGINLNGVGCGGGSNTNPGTISSRNKLSTRQGTNRSKRSNNTQHSQKIADLCNVNRSKCHIMSVISDGLQQKQQQQHFHPNSRYETATTTIPASIATSQKCSQTQTNSAEITSFSNTNNNVKANSSILNYNQELTPNMLKEYIEYHLTNIKEEVRRLERLENISPKD